jgi:hypothetical protein
LQGNGVFGTHKRPPLSEPPPSDVQAIADVIDLDRVRRRDLLAGLIHEYSSPRSPTSATASNSSGDARQCLLAENVTDHRQGDAVCDVALRTQATSGTSTT